MHRVEIIGVGSELLWGYTLDTNTAEIAQSLRRYVVRVVQSLRVADELDALTQAVREALARAELVVLTGGLGPTPDDITREAVARVFSSRLELDKGALSTIESFFETRGLTMPEANRKQAMRIPAAELLPNPRGTAPGWWVHQGSRSVVLLPGPPDENTRAEPPGGR